MKLRCLLVFALGFAIAACHGSHSTPPVIVPTTLTIHVSDVPSAEAALAIAATRPNVDIESAPNTIYNTTRPFYVNGTGTVFDGNGSKINANFHYQGAAPGTAIWASAQFAASQPYRAQIGNGQWTCAAGNANTAVADIYNANPTTIPGAIITAQDVANGTGGGPFVEQTPSQYANLGQAPNYAKFTEYDPVIAPVANVTIKNWNVHYVDPQMDGAVFVQRGENVIISGISISGPSPRGGIGVDGCDNVTVTNCATPAVDLNHSTNVTVSGIAEEAAGAGNHANTYLTVEEMCRNCRFTQNTALAFRSNDIACSNITVANNHFVGANPNYGSCAIAGGNAIIVTGNTCGDSIWLGDCMNCIVSGNTFVTPGIGASVYEYGSPLWNVTNRISGNTFAPASQPATAPAIHGSTAIAIARFDTPDGADDGGTLTIGVAADHINGIKSVDFTANSGPVTTVTTVAPNLATPPRQDDSSREPVYLYTPSVTGIAPNTLVTVQAVVHPTVGVDRIITLPLLANPSRPIFYISATGSDPAGAGTQANPWATIQMAATTAPQDADVYFETAGTYTVTTRTTGFRIGNGHWLHFRLGAGLKPGDVTVVMPPNCDPRLDRVAFHDCKIDMTSGAAWGGTTAAWFDDCEIFSSLNASAPVVFFSQSACGDTFFTNCYLHDFPNTPINLPKLLIGSKIQHVTGHGWNTSACALNNVVDDIYTVDPTAHIDGVYEAYPLQGASVVDANAINANLVLTSIQGLAVFADQPGNNTCLRNITGTGVLGGINGACQFGKSNTYTLAINHLILRNVNLTNQSLSMVGTVSSMVTWTNTLVDGCSVAGQLTSDDPGIWLINNRVSGVTIPNVMQGSNP